MKQLSFFVLLFLFLQSCSEYPETETVLFQSSLPEGKKTLNKFPKKYRGQYLHLENDSKLNINSYCIVKEFEWRESVHKSEVDSVPFGKIKTDTSFFLEGITYDLKFFSNDSLMVDLSILDTLFRIDSVHLLKLHKGSLLLNSKIDDGSWDIKLLQNKNGLLVYKPLLYSFELDTLSPSSEVIWDTVGFNNTVYIDKLEKKELKEVMRFERNSEGEYQKVK